VNISNGGTVTALTRTAAGSGYTSFPSVAISAPTTAGGVQATAAPSVMIANAATIASGGTGYAVGNVVTLSGGTPVVAATFTVTAVSGGVVTAVSSTNFGTYSALPSSPVSTTGGAGTGLTLNVTWSVGTTFTITNAGSGYVEQPTVTFSGGGGSGATAYATVGGDTTIKSLGTNLLLNAVNGTVAQFQDSASTVHWYQFNASSGSTGTLVQRIAGSGTNGSMLFVTKGTGAHQFATGNTTTNIQLQVSPTASAVNYVQATGAATSGRPTISTQGSDASINMDISAKGFARMFFLVNGARNAEFTYGNQSAGVNGNHVKMLGNAAGTAPAYSVEGTDTDIDVALTPKGAGNVRFGTYTGTILTPTGFITIKDSGGTTRRLLVG
jgi:hypothetical protein